MMRHRNSRFTGAAVLARLIVAVIVLVIPAPSNAKTGRELGGYRFIPVTKIEDPFITTHFRNYTGLSIASNVEFPIIVIPNNPPDTLLALNGDFLFVVANFEYQHAMHPRIAISVAGSGASRVGISSEALLSQGVTALTAGSVGGLFELWRNDAVLLSATANVGYSNGIVIDFVQFAEDVRNGNYKDASIIKEDGGAVVSGSLRVAWALSHWAGLLGSGQMGYADIGSLAEEVRWRLAASGSVDFGQRGNAPVGLQLNFEVDRLNPQAAEIGTAVGVGGGVYYTGREDFNVGLEITWARWPLRNWEKVANPVSIGLGLRYYF